MKTQAHLKDNNGSSPKKAKPGAEHVYENNYDDILDFKQRVNKMIQNQSYLHNDKAGGLSATGSAEHSNTMPKGVQFNAGDPQALSAGGKASNPHSGHCSTLNQNGTASGTTAAGAGANIGSASDTRRINLLNSQASQESNAMANSGSKMLNASGPYAKNGNKSIFNNMDNEFNKSLGGAVKQNENLKHILLNKNRNAIGSNNLQILSGSQLVSLNTNGAPGGQNAQISNKQSARGLECNNQLQKQYDHKIAQNKGPLNMVPGMSGVSPKNSFNQQLDKVFQTFHNQQANEGSTGVIQREASANAGSSSIGQAATAIVMPKKVANLPMVNSQQMTGQKVPFLPGMAQTEALPTGSLSFGDNEYSAQQRSAHTVKIDKQMKQPQDGLQNTTINYQASNVSAFNQGRSMQKPEHQQLLLEQYQQQQMQQHAPQQNAQNSQNAGMGYQSNNQRQQQRRKLLFEYGLEKKLQNQAQVQSQSQNYQINEQVIGNYNNKVSPNVAPPPQLGAQTSVTGPRYGAAQLAGFGAVKGSSLGHYPQQQSQDPKQMQQTPIQNKTPDGMAATNPNGSIPNSASQTQANQAKKASLDYSRSVNRNMQNDLQRSGARKYQNSFSQHKHQNSANALGLLEQLLMNLKAINIDRLDAKEQEQLRFLSAQYQFHLNSFQQYQKNQILNGNFEGASAAAERFGKVAGEHVLGGSTATGLAQSQGSRFNNQSGFSTRDNVGMAAGLAQQQTQLNDINGKVKVDPKNQLAGDPKLWAQSEQSGTKRDDQTSGQNSSSGHGKAASNNGLNNVYSSQERFVLNEKNLREQRLKNSRQRNENTPGEVTEQQSNGQVVNKGLHASDEKTNNSSSPIKKMEMSYDDQQPQQNALNQMKQSIANKDELHKSNPASDASKVGQGLGQAASQKNFNKNNSQSKFKGVTANSANMTAGSAYNAPDALQDAAPNLNNVKNGNLNNNQSVPQGGNPKGTDIFATNGSNTIQPPFVPQQVTTGAGAAAGNGTDPVGVGNSAFANDLSTTGSSHKNTQLTQKAPVPVTGAGESSNTIGDLPFSFHLNLPHPVPQITSSDIKSLNAHQRVSIFKHLQKREKSKFLGIQQNKMKTQEKQVQIKFTQQRFRSRQLGGGAVGGLAAALDKGPRDRGGFLVGESRAAGGGIVVGGSGAGARTGMSRFVSVGQRQQRDQHSRFNQMESELATQAQFDKQMENLRRQWASDLRAFGIFQQNELWQFSQMNDSQQKQILICNLQQGKFQGLIDEQYEMLMQKQAQQAWLNQKNSLLQREAEANQQQQQLQTKRESLSEHQDIQQQSKQQRRHTYGSALSSLNTGGDSKQEQKLLSKQQTFRNSMNLNNQQNIAATVADQMNGNLAGQSYDEKLNKQAAGLPGQGPQHSPLPNNPGHQQQTPTKQIEGQNVTNHCAISNMATPQKIVENSIIDQVISAQDKDKTININIKDLQSTDKQQLGADQQQVPCPSNLAKSEQDKINPTKMFQENRDLEGNQSGFNINSKLDNSADAQSHQQSVQARLAAQQADKALLINPIQKRYEDSKNQFQECLRQILCKYQNQINLSSVHTSGETKLGLENLLPSFTRNLLNKQFINKDFMSDMSLSLKQRQSESAKNGGKVPLNTISNDTNKQFKSKLKTHTEQQPASGKLYHKLKVNGKEEAAAGSAATGKKKESTTIVAPDSTKSGAKRIGGKDKDKDGEAGQGNGEAGTEENEEGAEVMPLIEEVKKPRYFPPRRLPNPFESAAQEQERFIQARKEALAKYSNISKNRYKQDESQPLKYVVRPGNNSKLILRVMEESGRVEVRCDKDDPDSISFPGWEPADDHYDSLYNFKWKPTSAGIKYDMISKHGLKQLVNHVKGHACLTTKDNLFLNMKHFYEQQKLNIFEVCPLTIVLDYLKDDVSEKVEQVSSILKVIDKHITDDVDTINQKLHEMQLAKEKSVKTPYKISECCHNQQNLWLLKPTGFNRGIGIHIFQTFDQLRDIMSQFYGIGRGARDKTSIFQTHNHNHNPVPQQSENCDKQQQMKNFTFVVQKLIERPMLYLKRKFDLRQWVLLNSFDGRVYVYRECYVRTSSTEYVQYDPNAPSEEQLFMQLTNNAVQKDGANYGKFEEGNIISSHTLFEYIAQSPEANGQPKSSLEERFRKDVVRIIQDTMKAVKGKIVQQRYTFELLGYDFILDENLNTILIEVNTNPCLEESNHLLRKLLPRMIDDLMNVVMDPLFGSGISNTNNGYDQSYSHNQTHINRRGRSKYSLPAELFSVAQNQVGGSAAFAESEQPTGYRDDENLFQHVCNVECTPVI